MKYPNGYVRKSVPRRRPRQLEDSAVEEPMVLLAILLLAGVILFVLYAVFVLGVFLK